MTRAFTITLLLLGAACQSAKRHPFEENLPGNYRILPSFRSENGAGTVVRFEDKVEHIVASRETLPCLDGLKFRRVNLVLPSILSVDVARREGSVGVPQTLTGQFDLTAAFEDHRVTAVVAHAQQPFEQLITEDQLGQFLEKYSADRKCMDVLYKSQNKVILSAIGSNALTYVFVDATRRAVSLDVDVLAKLKARISGAKFSFDGASLVSDEPMLIGAREVWACEIAGCDDLTDSQRRELRDVARQHLGDFVDKRLFVAPDIPDRLLKRIASRGIAAESVLVFYDTSRTKDAGRGLLITAGRVYWGVMPLPPNRLSYVNLVQVLPYNRGIRINARPLPLRADDNAAAAEALKRIMFGIAQKRKSWGL